MASPMVPTCCVAECVAIETRRVEIVQSVEILDCELAVGDRHIVSELPLGGSALIVSVERAVVAPRFAATRKTPSVPNMTRMSSKATTALVTTVASTGMEPGTMEFATAGM
jgi:hypothetical protein